MANSSRRWTSRSLPWCSASARHSGRRVSVGVLIVPPALLSQDRQVLANAPGVGRVAVEGEVTLERRPRLDEVASLGVQQRELADRVGIARIQFQRPPVALDRALRALRPRRAVASLRLQAMQLTVRELRDRIVRVRGEHTVELTLRQREAPGARVERGVLPHERTHPARELLRAPRDVITGGTRRATPVEQSAPDFVALDQTRAVSVEEDLAQLPTVA